MTAATVDQWIDEDEAACRLLVLTGDELPPIALQSQSVAGFVSTTEDGQTAEGLVAAAHAAGKVLLVLDQPELARRSGADGVLLHQADQVARARDLLGPDSLVGAICGLSRHQAMVAGEAGADYVTFGSLETAVSAPFDDLLDVASWWSDLAVIPAVVAASLTAPQVKACVDARVGFVLPTQMSLAHGTVERKEFDALAAELAA